MKTLLTAIYIIFTGATLCHAQTTVLPWPNAISFEIGKNGIIYNLTYDYKPLTKNFGFRIGVGSNLATYLNAFSIGTGSYYLFGQKKQFLELGLDVQYLRVDEVSNDQVGFAIVYPDYSIKAFYPSMNIGYRAYGKIALFRVGASPGLIKNEFIPGGYISIGFRF